MSNVAIIGIGCRFPGDAINPNRFWALLSEGRTAITEIPSDRWRLDNFYDPNPNNSNRSYSKWGGFLSDIRSFDAGFFNLSRREAETLDPQQRLLLQITYECIQDANVRLADLQSNSTGVFIGASNTDYGLLQRFRHNHGDILAGTGTALSILANRISNSFNFTGPSTTFDTACSSSIVALDAACESLSRHTCEYALVAGVNILLDPKMFMTFCRARMLSPTGKIRAFDKLADGFVRGEGAGMVLLKRKEDALRDGNNIYASIEASMVNQDGGTGTITAPNKLAQMALMRSVLSRANRLAREITYVEAHGTGTPLGDPIEAQAIGEILGTDNRLEPLLIGSVKPNIGHLEPAAGIAGVIKAALAIKFKEVPPNYGFCSPNPQIAFDALNLAVPTTRKSISDQDGNSLILVNSFGFGGTNACALFSTSAKVAAKRKVVQATTLLQDASLFSAADLLPIPLSARSFDQLKAYALELSEFVNSDKAAALSFSEIAALISSTNDHFEYRAVIIARSKIEFVERLKLLSEGSNWEREDKSSPEQIFTGKSKPDRKIAFTLAGQGGQWWAMGRHFLESSARFRSTVEEFDNRFFQNSGWRTVDVLESAEECSSIHQPAITPAVMFSLQSGLASLWRSSGIEPEILIGHSFGEVTAAYLGSAIDQDAVAHLVTYRGSIRDHIDRVGAMAAIGLGSKDIQKYLPSDGSIEIGAYNSPSMVTLSGDADAIDLLLEKLKKLDPQIQTHKLDLDFAWHSSWLEPVEKLFKKSVGPVRWTAPKRHVISTVTGKLESCFDTDYWWRNLRYPVKYQNAIDLALMMGANTFIELGPHRALSSLTAGCAAALGKEITTVSTLHRQLNDFESFACAIGELYINGIEFDWVNLLGKAKPKVTLPKLPWITENFWTEPEETKCVLRPDNWHPLLGTRDPVPSMSWSNEISINSFPSLADHRIFGRIVFPASCYIEIMRAAIEQSFHTSHIELRNIQFFEILYLDLEEELILNTLIDQDRRTIKIFSRFRSNTHEWIERCSAKFFEHKCKSRPRNHFSKKCPEKVNGFYEQAQELGYQYGPAFQGLKDIHTSKNEIIGKVEASFVESTMLKHFELDPALLDSCFQLMIVPSFETPKWERSEVRKRHLFLPKKIERLHIRKPLIRRGTSYLYTEEKTDDFQKNNFLITNSDGQTSLAITGFIAAKIFSNDGIENETKLHGTYYRETYSEVSRFQSATTRPDEWVIIGDKNSNILRVLVNSMDENDLEFSIIHIDNEVKPTTEQYFSNLQKLSNSSRSFAILYITPISDEIILGSGSFDFLNDCVLKAVSFGQALEMINTERRPQEVWFLTDKIQIPGGLSQIYLGLVRTLALELPNVTFHLADLDKKNCEDPDLFTNILNSGTQETELIFKDSQIFAPRLHQLSRDSVRINPISPNTHPSDVSDIESNFELRQSIRGRKDSLEWWDTTVSTPGPGEVLVKTRSVGLNFRDVMATINLLPEEAESDDPLKSLGLEFSGTIQLVGPGVTKLKTRDQVFGLTRGALKKFITTTADQLYLVPDHLPVARAAAIPSAYLTVFYSLIEIARMAKGERVLIHNASGGVGLAAVALARHAGAEIFATAGNQYKRDYLKKLGIENVFDSRSLEFSEEILKSTNGRGVDIILNSLSGPFIEKNLDCLAPYGRYLELGKKDIYEDVPIGLRYLRKNISIHAIDVADLVEERPEMRHRLMRDVIKYFNDEKIPELPIREFGASKIADAIEEFSSKYHIGKIVINLNDPEIKILRDSSGQASFDQNASYLVTGGTKGFGLEAACWLSKNGAGRILLASKSGVISKQASNKFDELKKNCADVTLLKLDVADIENVFRSIDLIQRSDKPLKGVIHSAAHYQDSLLNSLSPDQITAVLTPKIKGGVNLTRAIIGSNCNLDFFISFSSFAQTLGWKGQSHYAAANSFLISLSHYQNSLDIPGKCIVWGALGESGHVYRNESISRFLENSGLHSIGNKEALMVLNDAINSDIQVLVYAGANWQQLAISNPVLKKIPRLRDLVSERSTTTVEELSTFDWKKRSITKENFAALIRKQLSRILHVKLETLEQYDHLEDAGLDSLSTFELKHRLEGEIGIDIPFRSYANSNSVSKLSEILCNLWQNSRSIVPSLTEQHNTDYDTPAFDDLLPAQSWFLDSVSRPMTSKFGRKALFHWVKFTFSEPIVRECLQSLWSIVESKILAGSDVRPLTAKVTSNSNNKYDEQLFALLAPSEKKITECSLKISKALADDWSVAIIIENFLQMIDGRPEAFSKSKPGWDKEKKFRVEQLSGLPLISNEAYWRTILLDAPTYKRFAHRTRALAPAGLGQNSGPAQQLVAEIIVENACSESFNKESFCLACFAIALAHLTDRDDQIIEVELSSRKKKFVKEMIGPISKFIPVISRNSIRNNPVDMTKSINRQLEAGQIHSGFDIFSMEDLFQVKWQKENIIPSQFGFNYTEFTKAEHKYLLPPNCSNKKSRVQTVEKLSPSIRHDLHLQILNQKDKLTLTLNYDQDVIDELHANKVLTMVGDLMTHHLKLKN